MWGIKRPRDEPVKSIENRKIKAAEEKRQLLKNVESQKD